MNQMNVAVGSRVGLDFRKEELPISVKLFRPRLFQDEEGYYCLFGPDTGEGIFGYGQTVDEALERWDMRLRERIRTKDLNDEVAQYALQILDTSVEYS